MKGQAGDLPVTVARGLTQLGKGPSLFDQGSGGNVQKLFRKSLAGAIAVAAGVGVSLVGASPAFAATHYHLVNYKSGLCLSIEGGGSTANGAHAIQWYCNDGAEQLWHWSGSRLVNDKSGKCLSIDNGGSTANGAHAIQWTCNGGPEQNWDENGGYLVNGKSNKVLSIEDGGSTVAGKHAIQWSANGGSEQGWDFQAIYIDA